MSTAPVEARDYLRPELTDKLVLTCPNDDDAVLWQFQQLVREYGWGYWARSTRWRCGSCCPCTG